MFLITHHVEVFGNSRLTDAPSIAKDVAQIIPDGHINNTQDNGFCEMLLLSEKLTCKSLGSLNCG